MATSITYPDGSNLSSPSLTRNQIETIFQKITGQMLGLYITSLNITVTLVLNSTTATVTSVIVPLYAGISLSGTGIPAGTTITNVSGSTITLSNAATVAGSEVLAAIDNNAPAIVKIGWMTQGQPGPDNSIDSVFVRCQPLDTPYSRMRDNLETTEDIASVSTDIFTRTWTTTWDFYGPDSLNNAKLIKSGITMVPYVERYLSQSNLYVNPSIKEPESLPENFQGQWWERAILDAEFNEQITEVITAGTVQTVPISIVEENGLSTSFTVTGS
jgi:hypothetical protein